MQRRRWPKCILLQYLLDIHTITLHSERSRGGCAQHPALDCIMQGCHLHVMQDGSVVIRIISYVIVILHFGCIAFKTKAPETLPTEGRWDASGVSTLASAVRAAQWPPPALKYTYRRMYIVVLSKYSYVLSFAIGLTTNSTTYFSIRLMFTVCVLHVCVCLPSQIQILQSQQDLQFVPIQYLLMYSNK